MNGWNLVLELLIGLRVWEKKGKKEGW